jgi:hypothetical protein
VQWQNTLGGVIGGIIVIKFFDKNMAEILIRGDLRQNLGSYR